MENEIFQMINDGHSLIITGYPGTGKSHILARKLYLCQLRGKKVRGTASTGKSAVVLTEGLDKINCNYTYVTFHKCFGILDGRFGNDEVVDLMHTCERYEKKRKELLETDVIVIDEIPVIETRSQMSLCRSPRYTNRSVAFPVFGTGKTFDSILYKQLDRCPERKACNTSRKYRATDFPQKLTRAFVKYVDTRQGKDYKV